MNQKEIVLHVMRDAAKPLRSGEIAELAGLDKKEVDKAMKELKSVELIFSPIRCFWQASNS
jgi:DNA-binding transcriptional regulator GbsR (MarR family)